MSAAELRAEWGRCPRRRPALYIERLTPVDLLPVRGWYCPPELEAFRLRCAQYACEAQHLYFDAMRAFSVARATVAGEPGNISPCILDPADPICRPEIKRAWEVLRDAEREYHAACGLAEEVRLAASSR